MKPLVLLDVDGPLTSGFVDKMCRELRRMGLDAKPETLTAYDLCWSVGATRAQRDATYAALAVPGASLWFEPRAGAVEFVKDLREWADVRFVTAPLRCAPTWASDRMSWLVSWFNAEPRDVISCDDKSLIRGAALLDDKPDNLRGWLAREPAGAAILWSEPYNRADAWGGLRVDSLDEAANLLRLTLGYEISAGS